ncbi:response regulator receiver protein [Arcobacter nitrofigilis DSM 7299]|uniref:Response regulator receiver protein n=1 Tax=Arcobacter nitrofigilis (strain ATCC 33309 / DSM 7299 / CCUG 15893 / LMG 7604 / NCTC 12251 / CI) TaxID=572480 RepID=D5V6T8_ARCNC|nr:response regulator [Arcobacter nitrofigilis]ADG94358.1 response regulator receiver protein [Arcobacter nitrofigilis DSM 7299]
MKNILKYLTVLYVEDDNEVRENITNTISNIVKKVYSASNAKEALEIYDDIKPDIIFTDIDMEGMNGLELIKEIREEDSQIPVVVLTAYKTESFLMEAVSLHLESYIIKPISYTSLKEALFTCSQKLLERNRFEITFPNGSRYNLHSHIFTNNANEIEKLQNKERLLLETLIEYKNELVFYDIIEENVWEGDLLNKGTLKVLIGKLRQKIGKESILNENEQGYRLLT